MCEQRTKSEVFSMLLLLFVRPNKIVACFTIYKNTYNRCSHWKSIIWTFYLLWRMNQTWFNRHAYYHAHTQRKIAKKARSSSQTFSLSLSVRLIEIDEMLFHITRMLNSRSREKHVSCTIFAKNVFGPDDGVVH